MSSSNDGWKAFGCILLLLSIPISYLWSGYVLSVLSVLWGWFMVTQFGLPVLSIPGAIGVAIVIGYLTKQYSYSKDAGSTESTVAVLFYSVFNPAFALFVGWIVKSFMG